MNGNHTHYFVVSYDSSTNKWEWDTNAEEAHFSDGTVKHNDTYEWSVAYLGDGEYIDNEDELSSLLSNAIYLMNCDVIPKDSLRSRDLAPPTW